MGVSISIPTLNRDFIRIMGLNDRNRIAMANLRRLTVNALVILALLGVLVGLGQATMVSVAVQSGEEVTHPLDLVVEDHVLIQYRFVEGNVSALRFSISFPNGTLRAFGGSGDFSYSFICDVEGEYVLHFVNTDQSEVLRLVLDYEVQHYIFGIPQMLFMAIIVVLACIGGVFAFVIMGRPR